MTAARADRSDLKDLTASVEAVLQRAAGGPIAFEDNGSAAELWTTAVDLGWAGLGLDEQHGGSGGGLDELAVLLRAVGRWVAPGPFLGTAAAAVALDTVDTAPPAAGEILAAGISLAVEPGSDGPATHPRPRLRLLQPPEGASHALAFSPGAVSLLPLPRDAAPVTDGAFDPGFPTREVLAAGPASIRLDSAERGQLDRSLRVLLAANALGISDRMMDVAVQYARQRHQFGKPIGSFQAVKHRCATMAIRHRAALAALSYALTQVWSDAVDGPRAAQVACEVATAAAVANAEDCLETHGAIGHTWEFAGHRFLKRAHVLSGLSTMLLEHPHRNGTAS